MVNIGKRETLSIRRRQSLLSQMAVAAKIGVAQSQYSNIENGYANPTEEQARVLTEMFSLPEGYFAVEGADGNGG